MLPYHGVCFTLHPPEQTITVTNRVFFTSNIMAYLSDSDLQERLGVDPPRRGPFNYHSTNVSSAFFATMDLWNFPAHYHIAALLERGIRVLVYVGQTDFICNWVRTACRGFRLSFVLT